MKPARCEGCPLYHAQGPVGIVDGEAQGDGPSDARVVLLGEAPGRDEVARKRPFVGPAGRVLNLAIKAAGMERKALYVTNAVKCLPTGGPPSQAAIHFCRDAWLLEELRRVNPNVVVAVGGVSLEAMMRDTVRRKITEWRGYVVEVNQGSGGVDDGARPVHAHRVNVITRKRHADVQAGEQPPVAEGVARGAR
jgi:DNA polymerase